VTFAADIGSSGNDPSTGKFSIGVAGGRVAGPFNGSSIDVGVLNAETFNPGTGSKKYIDITFDPTPGRNIDYSTILDTGDEISLSGTALSGTPTIGGRPIPIALTPDDDGILVPREVELPAGDAGDLDGNGTPGEDSDLFIHLGREGVRRFRYMLDGSFSYQPGTLTVTLLSGGAGGWSEKDGEAGQGATINLRVEGPTAQLSNPSADSRIDVAKLNKRNYIDVTFPDPPSSEYEINPASITDLPAEFRLTGDGVGDVKLDAEQAPLQLGALSARTFRYWVTGTFAPGDVTVEFLPKTWSFTKNGYDPSDTTATITKPTFVDVIFPAAPT
jgi:hypothetical protein